MLCFWPDIAAEAIAAAEDLAERDKYVSQLRGVMDGGVTSRPANITPDESRPKPQKSGSLEDLSNEVPAGRVSPAQLASLLQAHMAGASPAELAAEYSVDPEVVKRVVEWHNVLVIPKPKAPGSVLDITHLKEY